MNNLAGNAVLVTGGTMGIGLATAWRSRAKARSRG
jgi:short-subunit dehydrogenase involved in D-alanine esterification of teichoic acids